MSFLAILWVKPGSLCKYLVDPFLIRQPLVLVHVVKANRQKGTRVLGAESVHLEIAWKNVCFSVPVSRTKGCRRPQKGGSQTSQCRIHGHRWHGWTRVRGQLGTAALLALRNNDRPKLAKGAMPRSHWGTNDPVGSWNPLISSNWIHGIPLNLIESDWISCNPMTSQRSGYHVIFCSLSGRLVVRFGLRFKSLELCMASGRFIDPASCLLDDRWKKGGELQSRAKTETWINRNRHMATISCWQTHSNNLYSCLWLSRWKGGRFWVPPWEWFKQPRVEEKLI